MATFYSENMTEEMNALIAKIYETFSYYSINEIKGVCTGCCLSQDNIEKILTLPLHEISWQTIYEYVSAIKYNEESFIPQIRYLLPRIIELYASSDYLRQPSEYTFEHCYFDKSEYWNEQEIALIREFAKLHFKEVIVEYDKRYTLDEPIITWQKSGLNIEFLFDIWSQAIDYPKALSDYASMIGFNFKDLNYESVWTSSALAKQFTNWALSDEVFNTFSERILIAVEDIDSLDDYQLDSYENVLRLI